MIYNIGLDTIETNIDTSSEEFKERFNSLVFVYDEAIKRNIEKNINNNVISNIFTTGYKDRLKIRVNNNISFVISIHNVEKLHIAEKTDNKDYNDIITDIIDKYKELFRQILLCVMDIFRNFEITR